MKKAIGILTDSHSSITPETAAQLGVMVLPMPFYVDGECWHENETLSREQFFAHQRAGKSLSTSQPSPDEVMHMWDQALETCEQLLYFPISSGLSGSYSTACVLSKEQPYLNRVFVVDAGRVSTLLHQSILDALELIEEGYSAEEIRDIIERDRSRFTIYIAVDSLDSLRRGGRISPGLAALGSLLGIKPVLQLTVGKLDLHQKVRGAKNARKAMITALKNDMETQFKDALEQNEITVMIATSADEALRQSWEEQIRENFPGMRILSDDLSLGICAHIGEGALGIGLSCRPRRPQKV